MDIGLFGSGIVHKASKELAESSRHMACCPKRRDGRHRSGSLVEVRFRHRRDTPLQGLRKLTCSRGHDAKTTNNPPHGSTVTGKAGLTVLAMPRTAPPLPRNVLPRDGKPGFEPDNPLGGQETRRALGKTRDKSLSVAEAAAPPLAAAKGRLSSRPRRRSSWNGERWARPATGASQ